MLETKISDVELWAEVQKGDELAFNELFKRYWIKLYKTAWQYLKNKETSEEVVHDVFLNIWDRRAELNIICFPNFLLTAVRYQVYNRMRAAKLYVVQLIDNTENIIGSELNTGENKIQEQELQQELYKYLGELPKRCQEIFCLSRIEHLSNQEISIRLGISKRTVENQITVALKHLRACFKHITTVLILLSEFILVNNDLY